ncbi:hypothetical protein [Streptomyces sp. NPDC086519]|uniref:hypothetical protein n=1 Tax=Streptomyces sp. NPDC086519 TaxID=3154863 RepID=UPI0034332DD3
MTGDGTAVREAFRTTFRGRTPGGNPAERLNSLVADGRFVEDGHGVELGDAVALRRPVRSTGLY